MLVWAFGGSDKRWIRNICDGFDVTYWGRHNVDYSDVQGFIAGIDAAPDVIVYNINNTGHNPQFDKVLTESDHFERLCDIINTTYRFQLNLLEWFFHNYSNRRVLWITSMEPYNIDPAPEKFDGDILMYRQVRALEHQAMYQQNIKPSNLNKNNIAMGTCVANNTPGTEQKLNTIIAKDLFRPFVCGIINQDPLTDTQLHVMRPFVNGINLLNEDQLI